MCRPDSLDGRTFIRRLLDDSLVDLPSEIGEGDQEALLGGAAALLILIDWPEPFGLVAIEAMACGTPVIAFPAGSALVPVPRVAGAELLIVGAVRRCQRCSSRASRLDARQPSLNARRQNATWRITCGAGRLT